MSDLADKFDAALKANEGNRGGIDGVCYEYAPRLAAQLRAMWGARFIKVVDEKVVLTVGEHEVVMLPGDVLGHCLPEVKT